MIGAVPAMMGATRGKPGRGLFALFTCAAAGAMGGMLFAVPVAAFMPASHVIIDEESKMELKSVTSV